MPEDSRTVDVGRDNKAISRERATERAFNDPCLTENEMTMRCLGENGYDRSKCEDYFKNYKNCRKFWAWIVKERKKQGILPHLPPPEDRDQVKQEYLPKLNKSF